MTATGPARHALAVHCPGCNQPIEVLLTVNHGSRWGNTHITLDRPINHVCQEDPMPAPHADRDGSEQPIVWPPKQRRDAEQGIPAEYVVHRSGKSGTEREVTLTIEADADALHAAFREAGRPLLPDLSPRRESVRASEAQVEAARLTWDRVMPLTGGVTLWQAVADAVVAAGPDADEVASLRWRLSDMADEYGKAGESWDRSRERLEAEVKRLSDEASRSATEVKRLTKAHLEPVEALARAVASVTPCSCSAQRSRAEAAETARDEFERAYVAAEAERDRLAETVERVRAKAEGWRGFGQGTLAPRILAILDDPASTPETPHTPAGAPESASGQSGEAGTLGGAEIETGCSHCLGLGRCYACGRADR